MLLLVLLPLGWLQFIQTLTDTFRLLVLLPHFQLFGKNRNAALGADDLAAQIIIIVVHGFNFFIKLRHGADTVLL